MSKFPKSEPAEDEPTGRIVGSIVTGAFECNSCGKVTTTAIWSRLEERMYWDCPDGHSNQIHFKV